MSIFNRRRCYFIMSKPSKRGSACLVGGHFHWIEKELIDADFQRVGWLQFVAFRLGLWVPPTPLPQRELYSKKAVEAFKNPRSCTFTHDERKPNDH